MLQKYLQSVILLLLAYITHIVIAEKCFQDRDELKSAVDEFIDGDCGDSNNKLCNVTNTYGPMNSWCIGNVTSLRYLFSVKSTFNEDISGWDTSRVTSMEGTFSGASLFSGNQIGSWNVSSVTNMKETFLAASSFDANLSQWDVSSVTTMRGTFNRAYKFEGKGLENWVISSTTDMGQAFKSATSFSGNISAWDVSGVSSMYETFHGAKAFNADLSSWQVSRVTSVSGEIIDYYDMCKNLSAPLILLDARYVYECNRLQL